MSTTLSTTATVGSCHEKDRLFRAHSCAAADHIRAVLLLNERTGVMSKGDYEAIRRYADKADHLEEQARLALERHTGEHGC